MTPYQPYLPPAVLVVEPRHFDKAWAVVALLLLAGYAYGQ